eukprot:TRINITY_DN8300_c0_g1_i2.p1 TRINITY_DN8300_c0_g1~~TRINITY_DN8300_c0_g1_i2.p1  ORF type:complete len:208 (-),score=48.83 TRINITY_DN8300_c0_g1_i2:35-658(-)
MSSDGLAPSEGSVSFECPAGAAAAAVPLFMGKKRRRKSSCYKCFDGDYLNICSNQSVAKHMSKSRCKEVLFADMVVKVNKRMKMQERILLITENILFNIDPSTYKVKRRISLFDVTSLTVSTKEDNFFCIHVGTEYDYLLVSTNKIEIILTLMMQYEALTELQLPVTFADTFEYKALSGPSSMREVTFTETEEGILTSIGPSKKSKG